MEKQELYVIYYGQMVNIQHQLQNMCKFNVYFFMYTTLFYNCIYHTFFSIMYTHVMSNEFENNLLMCLFYRDS